MYDSEKIRAAAEEAAKKGYFPTADVERDFRAEATPNAVLSMLDEIESLKLALKNMGLDADSAREEGDRMQAERDHWKANHAHQVSAARFLIERGDIPLERVRAYEGMQDLRAILKIIVNERFIPEEWPLLTARVKAALEGTKGGES